MFIFVLTQRPLSDFEKHISLIFSYIFLTIFVFFLCLLLKIVIENIVTWLSYKRYRETLDKHIKTILKVHAHMASGDSFISVYKKILSLIKKDEEYIATMIIILDTSSMKKFLDEDTIRSRKEQLREELRLWGETRKDMVKKFDFFVNNN